uniref:Uncharacterized protein ravX2 n=2 Tax=Streptomyces TaxID=1883 RepID=D1H0L1_9ACTN|nr:hypothetical protein [Streptomyces ravidus]
MNSYEDRGEGESEDADDASTGVTGPPAPTAGGATGAGGAPAAGGTPEASKVPEDLEAPENREAPENPEAPDGLQAPDTPEAPEPTDPAPDAPTGPPPPPPAGIAALTLPYQIAAAVVLGLLALAACIHLAMTFLHVAPSNTVTKEYGKQIDAWIYPEFEQNWKLFAPNPLQQNIGVQVKAEVKTADGALRTTEWIDLAAEDAEAIRGNLLPSHTQQNMLRRSWDFYQNTHDSQNRSTEARGPLAENYLRRLVMLRLADRDLGGEVERIQI